MSATDAWDAIADGARSLVQKDTALTMAQATDRFLKTDEGRAAYAAYSDQQAGALSPETHAGFVPQRLVKSRDAIWAAIEALAVRAVEKSDGAVSQAQAVDRILKTEEGRQLYALYVSGGVAATRAGSREPVQKSAATVREISSPGFPPGSVVYERTLLPNHDLIAKADADLDEIWSRIDEEARSIVVKGAEFDYADAVDRVLESRPDVAREYAQAYAARVGLRKVSA